MQRIVNTYVWNATEAEYEASKKKFGKGDILLFKDDPDKAVICTVKGKYADQTVVVSKPEPEDPEVPEVPEDPEVPE